MPYNLSFLNYPLNLYTLELITNIIQFDSSASFVQKHHSRALISVHICQVHFVDVDDCAVDATQ